LDRLKSPFISGAAALALLIALLGCQSTRERVLEREEPRNLVFQTQKMLPQIQLRETEKGSMALFEQSQDQSVHILQVARNATLLPRYHVRQDLTLVCVSGSAIVEIEGTRYALNPSSVAFVPRLHSYTILPHGPGGDFVAIVVFSPPYRAEDVVLTKKD